MSSDKLGSIQQPVVSVDLDLCEGGETRRENVELSKLEQLISSLEAANKVIKFRLFKCICIVYEIPVDRTVFPYCSQTKEGMKPCMYIYQINISVIFFFASALHAILLLIGG